MPATNTYSFTHTTGNSTTAWTLASDWSPAGSAPALTANSFKVAGSGGVNEFDIIDTSNDPFTLTGIGNGTEAYNLIINDSSAVLDTSLGALTVLNAVTLTAGTLSNASATAATTIVVGAALNTNDFHLGGANAIILGNNSGAGDSLTIKGSAAATGATLSGTGTVEAEAGLVDIGVGMTVTSANVELDILTTASLEFQGVANAGTIDFKNTAGAILVGASSSTDKGLLELAGTQVTATATTLAGTTFGASLQGLTTGNSISNGLFIAFNTTTATLTASLINVGTASATLHVSDGTNVDSFTLIGNYGADTASTVKVTSGWDIFLVCFGAGTAILTDSGEMPVESIQTGDTVLTLVDGAHVPRTVKWVGERTLNLARHPHLDTVAPVRVMKGALGDNLPHRDLILSPDHALFVDGGLIPAKLLVNGMTIVREMAMKSVTYYHIELAEHGILIAEGAAAESYLDTGNRAFFSNAGLATLLYPELTINENLRCWEEDACAPLTVRPDAVKPVWQRFADRALALGFAAPDQATTSDAAIHLMVDGKRLSPLAMRDQTVSFMIPAGAKSVRLMSRAVIPRTLTPWHDEPRNLGVAIRSVTLRDRTGDIVLPADHPALTAGWHAPEYSDDGAVWRWTDGDATLPIAADGPCAVEIAVSGTTTYRQDIRLAA